MRRRVASIDFRNKDRGASVLWRKATITDGYIEILTMTMMMMTIVFKVMMMMMTILMMMMRTK